VTEQEQDDGRAYVTQLAKECDMFIDNFLSDDKITDPDRIWVIKAHILSKMLINLAFGRNQDRIQVRKWFRDHWVPTMIKRINRVEITEIQEPPTQDQIVKQLMKGRKK
jgi:hypothetical protein